MDHVYNSRSMGYRVVCIYCVFPTPVWIVAFRLFYPPVACLLVSDEQEMALLVGISEELSIFNLDIDIEGSSGLSVAQVVRLGIGQWKVTRFRCQLSFAQLRLGTLGNN
jgi:hypothetical protein